VRTSLRKSWLRRGANALADVTDVEALELCFASNFHPLGQARSFGRTESPAETASWSYYHFHCVTVLHSRLRFTDVVKLDNCTRSVLESSASLCPHFVQIVVSMILLPLLQRQILTSSGSSAVQSKIMPLTGSLFNGAYGLRLLDADSLIA